jgi:hypothetical protein
MDCHRIQEYLEDNFLATGYELPAGIREHLDDCGECRSFYEEMLSLGEYLSPISDIAMTADETIRFETGLMEAIEAVDRPGKTYAPEKNIITVARMALAAAAVVVMILVSYNPDKPAGLAILNNSNAWQLAQISTEDMTPLLVNGGSEILPSVVDDQSAAYLTEQIQPWEADNILETMTSEELDWLQKNLTLEI